ncbi:hypothetical protein P879_09486 [Paragonimus westermani]|uniref:Uncharacterized protein n=1 Tax=Paragonimus westermani TaxID=34504 RepID=A0A8T0D3J4_9TREM|nr:hypothetical protein P879_09486 [Paragonimus westermani]
MDFLCESGLLIFFALLLKCTPPNSYVFRLFPFLLYQLEMALRHISLLELELQRQRCLTHEAQNARERQAERTRWEKRLAATLAELKQCQVNIGQLRAQMDNIDKTRTDKTQSQSQRGKYSFLVGYI